MMSSNQLRIMIYGAESLGYKVPNTSLNASNYLLEFCPLKTDRDFAEFDVVIFFERLFETVQQDKIICSDKAEMLKRAKQVFKLIEKGGYVCSLFYDIRDTYVTTQDDFLSLLQTANGWIKATKEAYEIHKE